MSVQESCTVRWFIHPSHSLRTSAIHSLWCPVPLHFVHSFSLRNAALDFFFFLTSQLSVWRGSINTHAKTQNMSMDHSARATGERERWPSLPASRQSLILQPCHRITYGHITVPFTFTSGAFIAVLRVTILQSSRSTLDSMKESKTMFSFELKWWIRCYVRERPLS